tara:strand:+ start:78 stop:866 length:789 start_codon:yes stop_codon:yes gene_type:complete
MVEEYKVYARGVNSAGEITKKGLGVGDWMNRLSEIYYHADKNKFSEINIISNSDTIKKNNPQSTPVPTFLNNPQIANLYLKQPSFKVNYEYKNVNGGNKRGHYDYLGKYWPAKIKHSGGDYIVVYVCIKEQIRNRSFLGTTGGFTQSEFIKLQDSLKHLKTLWLKDFNLDRNPSKNNLPSKNYEIGDIKYYNDFVSYLLNILSHCRLYIGSECFYTHLCKAMGTPFICLDSRINRVTRKNYYNHTNVAFDNVDELINFIKIL